MAKSKKELLAIRQSSYRLQHIECCETCRHYWQPYGCGYGFGRCEAIKLRGQTVVHECHALGTCDLWEGQVK